MCVFVDMIEVAAKTGLQAAPVLVLFLKNIVKNILITMISSVVFLQIQRNHRNNRAFNGAFVIAISMMESRQSLGAARLSDTPCKRLEASKVRGV